MNTIFPTMKLGQSRFSLTKTALCLCFGLLASGCVKQTEVKKEHTVRETRPVFNIAKDPNPLFNGVLAGNPDAAKVMSEWVIRSKDNQNMPFAIIDKVEAKVYAFDAKGNHQGDAPVLLGLAKGDYSPPGLGDKPLSQIKPEQRITPAGRFVARMGRNHKGKEILWVDYDEALSLHPVVKGTPRDRRAQRLASETPLDNRISFGCINVPKPFFRDVIHSRFSDTASVIYILPETKEFGNFNPGRISLAPRTDG